MPGVCCGSKNGATSPRAEGGGSRGRGKRLNKRLSREQLEDLVENSKFTVKEVRALYSRFRRLAPYGTLNNEQFRQTLGVLGLTDNTFLPDRMFKVFDTDGDDALNFQEFAMSLAVMIRGSEDEKLRLSFDMTAGKRGAKGISNEDFHKLIDACSAMMNSLVAPTGAITSKEDVDRLFHDLSSDEGGRGSSGEESGEDYISWEAYKAAAQGDEAFLQCLGLKPNLAPGPNGKRPAAQRQTKFGRSSTAPGVLNTSAAQQNPNMAAGSGGGVAPPAGHHVVSQGQLEELRDRLSRLNALLAQGEFAPGAGFPASPSAQRGSHLSRTISPAPSSGFATSAASAHLNNGVSVHSNFSAQAIAEDQVEDLDERWWTPPKKKSNDLSRNPSSQGSKQHVPCTAAVFDEVTAELDRMLGWCAIAESSGETLHLATGLPLVEATLSGQGGVCPFTPANRDVSRDTEGQHEQANAVRSNVHKSRTEVKKNLGSSEGSSSAHDGTESRAGGGGGASAAGAARDQARAVNRRTRKKHRLLGPRKGLAVHFGHENWNMVVSMMIGIRMAVGRSKHEMQRELQPCDFYMKEKFSIVPRMANCFDGTVSRRVTMTRFVDYAPMVFQKIRSSFGIQHDEYIRSVGPEQLLGNMVLGNLSSLAELSSEGKSGSFFYYTADGNYMLKTVKTQEYVLLKKMLKSYYEHIFKEPGTLLCRFLGLHCLSVRKMRKGFSCGRSIKKLYFVVMANMFNTPYEIHRRYDLKGSWVGRETPAEKYDPTVALKDVDFQKANECIRVGEERRNILAKQLESDSKFLASQGVIDYSVLLGIHECSEETDYDKSMEGNNPCMTLAPSANFRTTELQPLAARDTPSRITNFGPGTLTGNLHMIPREVPIHRRDAGGMLSSDKRSRYFLGVIDILTPYDTFKAVEHRLKGLRWDPKGVSCCPPQMYSERFSKFMAGAFA